MASGVPRPKRTTLPLEGIQAERILARLRDLRADDADWQGRRTWSLVYRADDEHHRLLADAYMDYFTENALSPTAFPSLARMESEVVQVLLGLVGGDGACGTMTSGGTESTILAVKAHRDAARARGLTGGHILVSTSAHPAFRKAAELLGVDLERVPLTGAWTVDVERVRSRIRPDTILLAASAPCYPFGAIDPIEHLGQIAEDNGIGLHVDAALGGIFLGISRVLGRPTPPFGLDVPGVTSMAIDLHKFGYAAKGASAVLYRDPGLRRHQYFVDGDWVGGALSSPTLLGTRSGGAIAAAWAALHHLGVAGYAKLFDEAIAVRDRLIDGLRDLGFVPIGTPMTPVVAMRSDLADIHAVADHLDSLGWRMDRQQSPDCLHFIVQAGHAEVMDQFLRDTRQAVHTARSHSSASRGRLIYGQTASLDSPDGRSIDDVLRHHIDSYLD